MDLKKLQFAPGINRETTRYSNTGGWFDCDKIRFRDGLPEKIGGWTKLSTSTFTGTCRHLRSFRILDGTLYTLVGTHQRLHMEWGGDLYEITPWDDADTSLTDPFTTTNTSDEVQVTKTDHGRAVGDRVDITGSSSVGGISADDINGVREISTIVDDDNYKFTAGASATSSTSGGGSPVGIYYLLADGLDTQIIGSGWGSDAWGEGAWGEPGSSTIGTSNLRTWTSDTFGEDLFICAWDTGLFYWDADNGIEDTPDARPIPLDEVSGANGAPTVARVVMVSQRDRHAIAFGCDSVSSPGTQDPLLIRWADQENIAEWTPGTDNTSGSLLIGSGSEIIAAEKTRQEILVWTDTDLHSMQYVGGDFVYGIHQIARGTSIIGRNAATTHLGVAYWMGVGAFYIYDGQVREIPCSVADFVFQDINLQESAKVFAANYADEAEIIWLYPSKDSDECDRYVIFNVADGVWYYGSLDRTCWMDASVYDFPVAAGTDNELYYHENGTTDGSTEPASQIIAHIESSPIEIGDGYQFAFVDKVIPDVTFRDVASGVTPSVKMTLKAYRNSGSAVHETDDGSVSRTATSPIETFTENVWVRLRGRAMTFRLEDTEDSGNADFGWRLGTPRIQVRTDGRR